MAKLSDLAEMFCYGATKQPQNGDVAVLKIGANAGTKVFVVTSENAATITKNYIGIRCKDSATVKNVKMRLSHFVTERDNKLYHWRI